MAFAFVSFGLLLTKLLIVVTIMVVAYLIMPKPKRTKPDSTRDMENPTAEAGREIPVIFGTMTMKGLNVLDFTNKSISTYEIDA
jgi:hypothetical protein